MRIEVVAKIILILLLGLIAFQDMKERKVLLLLLLFSGVLTGLLHFLNVASNVFLLTIATNCCIIAFIVFILSMYSKIKLKMSLKETFGSGDTLFFLCMAFGFPTATFLVLFSFSLFFSGSVYFLVRKNLTVQTVPLAGLQALFLGVVYLLSFFENVNLYVV